MSAIGQSVTDKYLSQLDTEMARAARAALAKNATVVRSMRDAGFTFVGPTDWKTQDGRRLEVHQMEFSHLKNTKRYCIRKAKEWYENRIQNNPRNWKKYENKLAFWLYYKHVFSLSVDNWDTREEVQGMVQEIIQDKEAGDKFQSFLDELDA